MIRQIGCALACAALLSCVGAPARSEFDEARPPRPREERAAPADDEAALARETRLDLVIRLARTRNPELAEAHERTEAGVERARSLGHWPDPTVSYQLWQQPLARPVSFGDANMHMLSVRQTIPAPGSAGARARGALEEAKIAGQASQRQEQNITAQARRVYAEYYAADREKVVHLSHVTLASELVDLTRAHYAAHRGTQQDVLRLLVALSQLHSDIAIIDQRLATSRAQLNALMGRPIDAPLGPPAEIDLSRGTPTLEALEKDIRARRPELVSAAIATRRAETQLEEARSRAKWPELTVGVDYMLMPNGPDHHNYGAMVGMSVPWLNPAHAEETRAAEYMLAAERRGALAAENRILAELRDASARLEAARRTLTIVDNDLLPQAQASFEAARAVYISGASDTLGLIDALRSYLDVRLERTRAIARVEESLADLELAGGAP